MFNHLWILYYADKAGHSRVLFANPNKSVVEAERDRRLAFNNGEFEGRLSILYASSKEVAEHWNVVLPFGDKVTNYRQISSKSWQSIATLYYPGANDALIDIMRVYGFMSTSDKTGYLRLYDMTNHNIIAEVNFNGNTATELQIDSAMENLPTEGATIEVQAKVGNNGGSFYVQSVELR